MVMATDLIGYGVRPEVAVREANGGTGPLSVNALPGGQSGAYQINGAQAVVFISGGSGGVKLPAISSTIINTPLLADDFVIHNGLASNVTVYVPTGVTINVGGNSFTSAVPFTLGPKLTLTLYMAPTTTQWFGLSA